MSVLAARCHTRSWPGISAFTRSRSRWTNLKFGFPRCGSTNDWRPELRLSKTVTDRPSPSRASTTWLPMKPAPPVTKTLRIESSNNMGQLPARKPRVSERLAASPQNSSLRPLLDVPGDVDDEVAGARGADEHGHLSARAEADDECVRDRPCARDEVER